MALVPYREPTLRLQIADIWIDVSVREQHNLTAEKTRFPIEDGSDITDHVRIMPQQLVIEGVVTNQPIELPGSHIGVAGEDKSGVLIDGEPLDTMLRGSGIIEGEPTLGALGLLPGAGQAAALAHGLFGATLRRREFAMDQMQRNPNARLAQYTVQGLMFTPVFDRVAAVEYALRETFEAREPVQIVTGLRVYPAMILIDLSIMRDATNIGSLHFGATAETLDLVASEYADVGAPEPAFVRAKPKVDDGNKTTAPVPEPTPQSMVKKGLQLFYGLMDDYLHPSS